MDGYPVLAQDALEVGRGVIDTSLGIADKGASYVILALFVIGWFATIIILVAAIVWLAKFLFRIHEKQESRIEEQSKTQERIVATVERSAETLDKTSRMSDEAHTQLRQGVNLLLDRTQHQGPPRGSGRTE